MFGKSVCVAALVAALGGCSHAGSITRTSADFNKAMANVRNEQLLLNIMRAAAREPLQFSAMGEINTTFDRTTELDLNNLVLRGANAMTQMVKLSGGNKPVVEFRVPTQIHELLERIRRRWPQHSGNEFAVGQGADLDRADSDRTMKTFAFLNQLIALQTESGAIGATPTVLAIDGD